MTDEVRAASAPMRDKVRRAQDVMRFAVSGTASSSHGSPAEGDVNAMRSLPRQEGNPT